MSGTIYALVYLVNNTNNLISIPFSGASTPDAWGTYGDTQQRFPDNVCMPDGTPPRCLAPGQVMVFGTKSDGGFGAMSGAGGKLSISLGSETAWMTWSVPWSYYNGLGGSANGDQGVIEPGFPSSQPFTMDGGVVGCTAPGEAPQQECDFVFTLAGGPPAGSTSPPNQLPPGVCISVPTGSPGPSPGQGTHSLTSPDGSTTLTFQNGALVLASPSVSNTWSSHPGGGIAAQMRTDGNFVVYDASEDVIWQTNTSGNPGAYLSVDAGKVSVLVTPSTGITETLWSASIWTPSPAISSLLLRPSIWTPSPAISSLLLRPHS